MVKKLTHELVLQRCKCDKVSQIKNLNMWGNELEDISILKEISNMEICSLSLNQIRSLKDFQNCRKLAELYLRKNQISAIQDIKYLQNLPHLKVLWLWDNPICQHPNYRAFIIRTLPNLTKLDNANITAEERQSAMAQSEADLLQQADNSTPTPTSHQNSAQAAPRTSSQQRQASESKSQNNPASIYSVGNSAAHHPEDSKSEAMTPQQQYTRNVHNAAVSSQKSGATNTTTKSAHVSSNNLRSKSPQILPQGGVTALNTNA